jgi:hypothetical protein
MDLNKKNGKRALARLREPTVLLSESKAAGTPICIGDVAVKLARYGTSKVSPRKGRAPTETKGNA